MKSIQKYVSHRIMDKGKSNTEKHMVCSIQVKTKGMFYAKTKKYISLGIHQSMFLFGCTAKNSRVCLIQANSIVCLIQEN